jgi:hypothetical protein
MICLRSSVERYRVERYRRSVTGNEVPVSAFFKFGLVCILLISIANGRLCKEG